MCRSNEGKLHAIHQPARGANGNARKKNRRLHARQSNPPPPSERSQQQPPRYAYYMHLVARLRRRKGGKSLPEKKARENMADVFPHVPSRAARPPSRHVRKAARSVEMMDGKGKGEKAMRERANSAHHLDIHRIRCGAISPASVLCFARQWSNNGAKLGLREQLATRASRSAQRKQPVPPVACSLLLRLESALL